MRESWTKAPQRGHPFAYRLILRIALAFGRPAARALLYPITAYFFLTSSSSRQVSRDFLKKALGRPATLLDSWRHHHCFASALLDRVFLLAGHHDVLRVSVHGQEPLDRLLEEGRGFMLLGSHLGSFEVLRALGVIRRGRPIRVVMETNQSPAVSRLLEGLNPKVAQTVIPQESPDALLRIQQSLQEGAMVGLLGDRVINEQRSTTAPFLGKEARFPTGPLYIARRLDVPVVLFFGVHLGGNRYEIHFEAFRQPGADSSGDSERVEELVARYAERLEAYARAYPYNWFNFYDFWND